MSMNTTSRTSRDNALPSRVASAEAIRCFGTEASRDGRCFNCLRSDRDCIFIPGSAQTQAFVPAHTVWRGVGQPPPMYGAYGQPLPPASHGEPYGQPSRRPGYLPSLTVGPYAAHSDYDPRSASPDNASRDGPAGRKRLHPEPHAPTLPPPQPGSASQAPHRGIGEGYVYPEPPYLTSAVSTANTLTPDSSAPPPTQPYYVAQPPRQASPQIAYHYEPSRTSSSPQSQAPTTPSAPSTPYYVALPQPNGFLQPTPTSTPSARPSMRINDLVSDNGPARSSTDSSMLNMLNRRPM
ncbi:hypothetical protein AA0119_g13353 [Alternaria tenuissima]|nr:hypothetical protein AA0119_g13353 [Alternaria tenuissima]